MSIIMIVIGLILLGILGVAVLGGIIFAIVYFCGRNK